MSVLTDLPKVLRSGIRKHDVPGATVAVYRGGRVTEAAAGILNVETRVPVTPDSVFQIGSISKVFTATIIMQLVDEGLVDIDQPLRTYLPDFAVSDGSVSTSVTARQLLCHSSGIEGDYFVDSGRGDDCVARLQDMGRLLPQIFPPGERMSYCNFGFAMLGRLIEVATGQTYDAAIRNRIFTPLAMKHALTLPEDTLRFRCAIGHVPDPKKHGVNRVTPMPWLSQGQKAAGSTPSMSAADLMKFVHMHLNGGQAKDGARILSRSSVRAMQRRQIRMPKHSPRGADGWGLGWFLCNWSGKRVIGHDGGTIGQYSFLRVLPEKRLAVVLLTNGGDAPGLYETIFKHTIETLGRVSMPELPGFRDDLSIDVWRLAGTYESLTGFVDVSSTGSRLELCVRKKPGQVAGLEIPKVPLRFVDRNTARPDTGDPRMDGMPIIFQGNDRARPDYLSMAFRLYRRQ